MSINKQIKKLEDEQAQVVDLKDENTIARIKLDGRLRDIQRRLDELYQAKDLAFRA